jgi:hypothetical protein
MAELLGDRVGIICASTIAHNQLVRRKLLDLRQSFLENQLFVKGGNDDRYLQTDISPNGKGVENCRII